MEHSEEQYQRLFGGVFSGIENLSENLPRIVKVQQLVTLVDKFLERFEVEVLLRERELVLWSGCSSLICLLETAHLPTIKVKRSGDSTAYPRTVALTWVEHNCVSALDYYLKNTRQEETEEDLSTFTMVVMAVHFSHVEMFEYLYFRLRAVDDDLHNQGLIFSLVQMLYPRELIKFVRVCLDHQYHRLSDLMSMRSFLAGLTPEIVEIAPVMCGRFFESTWGYLTQSGNYRVQRTDMIKILRLMNPTHLLQFLENLSGASRAGESLYIFFALYPELMKEMKIKLEPYYDDKTELVDNLSQLVLITDIYSIKYFQVTGDVDRLRKVELGYRHRQK